MFVLIILPHDCVFISVEQMQYTAEMCEGKLTPTRERDPFTLTLGKPYHPGRVVGVGEKRLGIEAVMGREYTKSTKSKPSSSSP